MKPIRIVCGTRVSEQDFSKKTALGRSLLIHQAVNEVEIVLFAENAEGLSTIYNRAIDAAKDDPAILVFVHDDVHLCDFLWSVRIREAVEAFDVVGLAGNTRRLEGQPAWAFVDDRFTWDEKRYLSGLVGHGKGFPCSISEFGPVPQECKLLDGLLLAADSERLWESGVRFDEQFEFHFYDMDFCRSAEINGLRMGTWPLSVVHESGGGFGTPSWRESFRRYQVKYAEAGKQAPQETSVQKQTPVHQSHNPDLLKLIPLSAKRIVEVGCSSGALAREYKKLNPDAHYIGIEIDPGYAELARVHCDHVVDMNIEHASIEQLAEEFAADCWIFGDVLEHLYDPWLVLSKIRQATAPGGCVVACIPNAQHWSVQARLSIGDFRYEDSGLFDRTHIRWFTLATMLELFTQAGLTVEAGVPRVFNEPQRERFLPVIHAMAAAAGKDPEMAVQDALPLQYVFRAIVG
ncbi:class I SAM-dependent methyltransferase [Pseudomonas monteilii]|uniref:class I SAM-dependent methyltransferase n=1 Tax=Pseudomonas monteilii TaxID=76759 RepID=UPI0018E66EFB|nr:class I SAM-dependent methyltransferase [Pseudomonas monteilii]MBI6920413.1 class I SAM-dependent methyltransferase [Pseudomonas monteilii]